LHGNSLAPSLTAGPAPPTRRAVRPLAAGEPPVHTNRPCLGLRSSNTLRACTSAQTPSPSGGLTRHSSGRLRRSLNSNVRPPRRHMTEGQHFASPPSATGALAESALCCPSVGGQRTNRLSHQALSQSPARPSQSRMVQRAVQRRKRLQRLLPWSLVGALTFAPHRRPNPSVKRTVNGGPRPAVSAGRAAVVRRLPHTLGR
jgi:hypothetical protein